MLTYGALISHPFPKPGALPDAVRARVGLTGGQH
jgi:hypothetical protein